MGDDWFQIDLPSLLLRPVGVPAERQDAARLTLERLDLEQGLRVLELRWEWYDKHLRNLLTLEGLREVAPLLARAVERWTADGRGDLTVIPRPVPDPYVNLV